jgi:hypothetical protein
VKSEAGPRRGAAPHRAARACAARWTERLTARAPQGELDSHNEARAPPAPPVPRPAADARALRAAR